LQKIIKNEKKVLSQILPSDFQLIKDDTVEELSLSFRAQILKSFLSSISDNNCYFGGFQFLK